MIIAIVPLLVALLGLAMYLGGKGKVEEVGKILLFVGILVLVLIYAGKVIRFG